MTASANPTLPPVASYAHVDLPRAESIKLAARSRRARRAAANPIASSRIAAYAADSSSLHNVARAAPRSGTVLTSASTHRAVRSPTHVDAPLPALQSLWVLPRSSGARDSEHSRNKCCRLHICPRKGDERVWGQSSPRQR